MAKSAAAADQEAQPRATAARLTMLACPACGTRTSHRFLYVKNRCEILQCATCGLGRAQAPAFDPAAYYTQGYFAGDHADGYADYLCTEPVLRREFARTVEFIRSYRPSGKLLEVGCAYGFFLQEAKRYFTVAGIELADDAADHCRRQGLAVETGTAEALGRTGGGPFDVIVLLDVIEHLPDPHAAMAALVRALTPGGVIVLTTGDFASLAARALRSAWRLMTPPQHLWFFAPRSMERLAAGAGLDIASLDHPWKIVPLSLVTYHLGRMAGLRVKLPVSRVGLPINLFDAMRVVLRRKAAL
jgi:2-polyprenyl-3-methyl-5-hydroxy-6-metoxy-1,4-benzoquinol methylase